MCPRGLKTPRALWRVQVRGRRQTGIAVIKRLRCWNEPSVCKTFLIAVAATSFDTRLQSLPGFFFMISCGHATKLPLSVQMVRYWSQHHWLVGAPNHFKHLRALKANSMNLWSKGQFKRIFSLANAVTCIMQALFGQFLKWNLFLSSILKAADVLTSTMNTKISVRLCLSTEDCQQTRAHHLFKLELLT